MIIPIPNNDVERVEELKYFEIRDPDPEEDFDEICATSISYVSLIDESRQWFKSTKGIEIIECPWQISICSYVINFSNQITEIPDA
jgi:hypothetical protein